MTLAAPIDLDRPPRTAALRLAARIGRRYRTTTDMLSFGPVSIDFTRVTDPNRVLDDVADAVDRHERLTGQRANDEQLRLPYWAELWDSSLAICQWLVDEYGAISPDRTDARALDLGCGMGLCGTVASVLGLDVLLADVDRDALLFARLNALSNGSGARTRCLNWSRNRLEERFDLIIGADILYERTQWEHLEPFWTHHLARGGRVLLAEPGRQTGEMFADWIVCRPTGWSLQRTALPVQTRTTPIRLFVLTQ